MSYIIHKNTSSTTRL